MAVLKQVEDITQRREMELRRELAAAYRLVALFGWDDHVATHMSARLPDGTYLLNPFGLMFDEITASSLIRVDLDDNVVEGAGAPTNAAGINIHGGILAGRSDVISVMHLHSRDGVAVSALKEGLLPLSQNALNIYHDVAYHEFEGVATKTDERERLQRDLGDKNLLILRNHGTLTVGRSIATAFFRLYAVEWACTAQVRTLSMGREVQMPSQAAQDSVGRMTTSGMMESFAEQSFWPAMLRKAERLCPGFDV
jgi:ribulose-5-phosphate 4-epimerase/fuculose-1-phosphate aldolase